MQALPSLLTSIFSFYLPVKLAPRIRAGFLHTRLRARESLLAAMASPRISSPPLLDETSVQPQVHLPVQWWKASEQWSGVKERGQDVCIRLVRNSMNDDVDGNNAVDLAYVLMHSGVLMECCHYFRDMAQSFEANPSPTTNLHEVTLLLDGDNFMPYIECFSIMYNPPQAGSQLFKPSDSTKDNPTIEDVKYGLSLLGAASHIGYDALSTSLCEHLMEMHQFSREMLVLAERRLRKEGLPYLVKAYCHCQIESVKCVIVDLMKKRRSQEWSPTPTFEWRVVAIVEKELQRLLVEAHNECGGESTLTEGNDALPSAEQMEKIRDMLKKVCDLLKVLLMAEVGSEGVKWLLQNSWIPKLLDRRVRLGNVYRDDPFYKAITTTVAKVYKEVWDRHVVLNNSDRHTLLKDWTFFMESLRNREALRGSWVQYEKAKKVIFCSLPYKTQMELLIMECDRGVFVTFGSSQELSKFFKHSMAAGKDES